MGLSFWMFCVRREPGSELVGMTGMLSELELELIADLDAVSCLCAVEGTLSWIIRNA
jgi:hypothetical protein